MKSWLKKKRTNVWLFFYADHRYNAHGHKISSSNITQSWIQLVRYLQMLFFWAWQWFKVMHEQLRVLWKSRDKEQSFVRGRLLAKNALNTNCSETNLLTEKWFTLIGHSLFFCMYKDSPDYSDVYLTDLFGPAVTRVDQKILDAFDIPEDQQVRTFTNF